VVALYEAAILDPSLPGAKAANLGRLASAGFPVPPGFVVTPAAEGHLRDASPRLLESAAALGAQRFAVRSSGTAEDLGDRGAHPLTRLSLWGSRELLYSPSPAEGSFSERPLIAFSEARRFWTVDASPAMLSTTYQRMLECAHD
jgi:hypothetical protein